MNILQIHNNYQQPGGETVVVEQEKSLLEKYGHCVSQLIVQNNEIKNYNFFEKILFFKNALYSKKYYKLICNKIHNEKPDIVHIHNVFPLISPSAYYACYKMGVPVVQTIHNFRFLCPNGIFFVKDNICEKCINGNTLHAVKKRCYKDSMILSSLYALIIYWHKKQKTFYTKITRLICLSNFVKNKIVSGGFSAEKITIKPNFLLPEIIDTKDKVNDVLFIGRLSREKGIYDVLEAADKLPKVTFSILGTGTEEVALRTEIKRRNIKNIKFLGFQFGSEKNQIIKKSKLLVLPSLCYETFGLVILEAFQYKVPVISSNIGSLPELVQHGKTGFLFNSGDISNLVEQIKLLLANSKKRGEFGENGFRLLQEKYSIELNYKQLISIYKQTLEDYKNELKY